MTATKLRQQHQHRDTIALVSGESRLQEIVDWCQRNIIHLNRKSIVADAALADLLVRNLPDLDVEEPSNEDSCPTSFMSMLIFRIRQGEISRVIFLQGDSPVPSETIIACHDADVPIALNQATADILIQSRHTTGKRLQADNRMAYLLYNPVAGSSSDSPQEELDVIYKILEPHIPLTVIFTKPGAAVAEQAKELVQSIQSRPTESSTIRPILLASGGDGTVSAVASATFETGIPFGVIPKGTANAFAVALGIPTDLQQACETILHGNTRTIDAAMINDKTSMILLAGIGFEAAMVESADRSVKNYLGSLAYVLGGAKEVIAGEAFHCTIVANGQELPLEARAVTVAVVAPATSLMAQGFGQVIPDDGLLDITIDTATSLLEGLDAMAHLMGAALVGRPTEAETVLQLRAKEVEILCEHQSKLVVDGELVDMPGSVKFRVLPGALNVIAPPQTEDD